MGILPMHVWLIQDAWARCPCYSATLCPAQSAANLANLAMAHFNLAFVYQQQGKKAEAIRQFQAVLEIAPGTPGVQEALAKLGAGSERRVKGEE